jgi:hypothetical protein
MTVRSQQQKTIKLSGEGYSMKKSLAVVFALAMASSAFAQNVELHKGPVRDNPSNQAGGGGAGGNLSFHTNGVVIRNANVVCIFWGPSFTGADASYASQIQSFRNQFGTTGEYNTITQYYGNDPVSGYGNIATGSLVGHHHPSAECHRRDGAG